MEFTYKILKMWLSIAAHLLVVRGDIARALMYMAVCYGFQQPRQAFASRMPQMLHNRNPFVDHPEYANLIWKQPIFLKTVSLIGWTGYEEHAAALAEGQPAPALCSSGDVRDLNMEDFKYAHQQVRATTGFEEVFLSFFT
ncbi:hypothetical protein GmHk_09G026090 [Glycine max]|nr:hypothetical protein GmHk_09G026090 [Glycine max]